jgi:hypothetical protein
LVSFPSKKEEERKGAICRQLYLSDHCLSLVELLSSKDYFWSLRLLEKSVDSKLIMSHEMLFFFFKEIFLISVENYNNIHLWGVVHF